MGNPAGVRRDFAALEARRMCAATLLRQGLSEAEVARRVGVHRQSVNRWARQLLVSGRASLKFPGRAGRKPKLTAAQLRRIERGLKRGPEALGFDTKLWTAWRVGQLLPGTGGLRLHPRPALRPLQRLRTGRLLPAGPPTRG